jgi:hypothetical protein
VSPKSALLERLRVELRSVGRPDADGNRRQIADLNSSHWRIIKPGSAVANADARSVSEKPGRAFKPGIFLNRRNMNSSSPKCPKCGAKMLAGKTLIGGRAATLFSGGFSFGNLTFKAEGWSNHVMLEASDILPAHYCDKWGAFLIETPRIGLSTLET